MFCGDSSKHTPSICVHLVNRELCTQGRLQPGVDQGEVSIQLCVHMRFVKNILKYQTPPKHQQVCFDYTCTGTARETVHFRHSS